MQTARCSCCGSKLPQPRQGSLSLGRLRQAARSPASFGGEHCQQQKRRSNTVTRSHKEDSNGNKHSATDKEGSSGKRKQEGDLDALREQMEIAFQSSSRKRKLSVRERLAQEWKAISSWVPLAVGVPGSVALVAGYLLHLDPYGHLHWSSHDALVGLACAAPTALADFGIMVPDFSDSAAKERNSKTLSSLSARLRARQEEFRRQIAESPPSPEQQSSDHDAAKDKTVSELSARHERIQEDLQRLQQMQEHLPGQGRDGDGSILGSRVEVLSSIPATGAKGSKDSEAELGSSKQSLGVLALKKAMAKMKGPGMLKETLKACQRKYVLQNPGRELLPPVEAAIILVSHLADEMLLRAILLAGLSGWATDRLFEAGGEEVLPDFVNATLSVPDVGKCTALAMLAGFEVGKAAAKVSIPFQGAIKVQGMEKALGFTKPAADIPTKKAQEAKKAEFMGMIQKVTKRVERRRHGEIIVTAGRKVLSLASFGGSFILTGNLLAPYIGAVSCDLLFSTYQRAKHEQLVERPHAQLLSRLMQFQAMQGTKQQRDQRSQSGSQDSETSDTKSDSESEK